LIAQPIGSSPTSGYNYLLFGPALILPLRSYSNQNAVRGFPFCTATRFAHNGMAICTPRALHHHWEAK
jgi:hypothetical protein